MGKEPPSETKENYVMFMLSVIHIRRDKSRSIRKLPFESLLILIKKILIQYK
jgi:hypothetical protein